MIFCVKGLLHGAIACVVMAGGVTSTFAQAPPHAAHGARLGGAFAAVAADTIHVEAVWSEQRRLRLFVWDASGEPMSIDRLREIDARVSAGGIESPLQLLEVESYFEARIPTLTLPAAIVVLISVRSGPEERVPITFAEYSPDAMGLAMASPPEIPATLRGILDAVASDRREAEALLDKREFFAMSAPEERIRERVLAIEPYLGALTAGERVKAEDEIASVVRACWLLHLALDYGDVAQRQAALQQLTDALDRTTALLAGIAR
jgi:hypothetical protein